MEPSEASIELRIAPGIDSPVAVFYPDTASIFINPLNPGTRYTAMMIPFINNKSVKTYGDSVYFDVVTSYFKQFDLTEFVVDSNSVEFWFNLSGNCDYVIFSITPQNQTVSKKCPDAVRERIRFERLNPNREFKIEAQVFYESKREAVSKNITTPPVEIRQLSQKTTKNGFVLVELELPRIWTKVVYWLNEDNLTEVFAESLEDRTKLEIFVGNERQGHVLYVKIAGLVEGAVIEIKVAASIILENIQVSRLDENETSDFYSVLFISSVVGNLKQINFALSPENSPNDTTRTCFSTNCSIRGLIPGRKTSITATPVDNMGIAGVVEIRTITLPPKLMVHSSKIGHRYQIHYPSSGHVFLKMNISFSGHVNCWKYKVIPDEYPDFQLDTFGECKEGLTNFRSLSLQNDKT